MLKVICFTTSINITVLEETTSFPAKQVVSLQIERFSCDSLKYICKKKIFYMHQYIYMPPKHALQAANSPQVIQKLVQSHLVTNYQRLLP